MESKLQKNVEQYIQLVYSEKSELNQVQDLEDRKKQACQKAKLNYDLPEVQDIIHLRNEAVNEKVFEHLRTQNRNDYILLVSDQHLFWEMQQRQIEPLDRPVNNDKDTVLKDLDLKTKLSEKSDQLLVRIKSRYKDVFGENEEVEMASKKIRLMRPEDRLSSKKSA
jgi:hypothetical protein